MVAACSHETHIVTLGLLYNLWQILKYMGMGSISEG